MPNGVLVSLRHPTSTQTTEMPAAGPVRQDDAVASYLAAQASANTAVHQTEQHLALAFQDGPGAAAAWANLMRSNDANLMLAACTGLAVRTLEGRKACNMPVWLDPPNLVVPSRAR